MVRLLALVAALGCLTPALAHAQGARDRALGRQLFRQGVTAARQGHWDEARNRFSRAYDLTHHAPILVNLAAADAELGHLVEATDAYSRYLSSDAAQGHVKQAAQAALDALQPRVPELTVTVHGAGSDDTLLLDDQPVPPAAWGTAMPVNPGAHHLAIERAGRAVASQDVTLAERAHQAVTLAAPAPLPTVADTEAGRSTAHPLEAPAHPTRHAHSSGGNTWWPWAVGGGVAVAAAITIVVIVVSNSGGQTVPAPYEGNLGHATF